MKSFSSSVINKSGKKFAPKAPVRRAAPAPPPVPSRRASVTSQVSASHPPARASETATPEPTPPAATTSSTVEPSAPSEPPIPESSSVQANSRNWSRNQLATAIPIPRPKRKASFSTAPLRPTKNVSAPPEASPAPSAISTFEPTGHTQDSRNESIRDDSDAVAVTSESENISRRIRPSKRPRTSIEPITLSDHVPDDSVQLDTPPTTQTPAPEESIEDQDDIESRTTTSRRASTAKGKRRASRAGSNDNMKDKPKERKPRSRKKREPTPEGSEMVEIAPSLVKMSELCKDLRTGKMSKRETELRNLELAELERKRAQQESEDTGETPIKQTLSGATPSADGDGQSLDKKPQAGPVMRIVNGEIVLDTASLHVDRHADAARNAGDLEDVVENSMTRKINQATYGKRSKTESWDEEMTDLFYRGLSIFGTDFMMISKLFPGRSRRQIKLKFNNEERRDPQRIKETLLGPRESIDISTYSEMTNTIYDDPQVIQQELDEEKKRIEEQHEKERQAQEELLRNPEGTGGNDKSNPDKMPTKPKRNTKKQPAYGGGTEEILGTIDD